jgi:hypothetical protein
MPFSSRTWAWRCPTAGLSENCTGDGGRADCYSGPMVSSMTQERFFNFLTSVASSDEGEHFANAYIVAAFEARDIGSRIVIDTKTRPGDGRWFSVHVDEENAPAAEVTFSGPAETFDKILRGDLGIMMAIASRKIVAEGKIPRAMRLVPAFERSLPHYR